MEKWQVDFLKQIKTGVSEDRAASMSSGFPLEHIRNIRLQDKEFDNAWSLVESEPKDVVSLAGTLMPVLPDTDDISELCKAMTVFTTKRLFDIALHSESETNVLKAIAEIHDRGWGRATQAIDHKGQITLQALVEKSMQIVDGTHD